MHEPKPEAPRRRLSRPVEVVRAELMTQPETIEIAKNIGMPLEEYVELVLSFAQDPDKEPELYVIDEEDAAEEGLEIPTEAEIMEWLAGVASGEIELGPKKTSDGFQPATAAEARIHRLLGQRQERPTTSRPERGEILIQGAAGEELKRQLRANQRTAVLGSLK